jgi:hypothetical protein
MRKDCPCTVTVIGMLGRTIVDHSGILVSFLLWAEILIVVNVICFIRPLAHLYWRLVLDSLETTR